MVTVCLREAAVLSVGWSGLGKHGVLEEQNLALVCLVIEKDPFVLTCFHTPNTQCYKRTICSSTQGS